jgi:tetratricopeptide (TPR) repeat protein
MEQHRASLRRRSWLPAMILLAILLAGCDFSPRQIPVLSERQRYEPLLKAIDQAETIKDPIQRCIQTPSPPHLKWPADMIEAFCRDQFTAVAQADVVRGMIDRKDWRGLDAHYAGYLERHFSGEDPERLLYRAFPVSSWRSDEEADHYSRRWQQAQPDNAFANMLRAKQLMNQAWRVRGNGFINDVDPKNLSRAIKLAREASLLALKAIKSEPRLMPAYSTLIDAYMLGGQSRLMHRALKSALRQSPHNYYIRADAAIYMQLRWGGTPEELERLSKQAEPSLPHNPRLGILRGAADAERSTLRSQAKRHGRALSMIRQSLEAGPDPNALYSAAHLSDKVGYESETLIYLTQMIRFERDRRDSLLYRGGIWELGGWYDRALRDYRAAQVFTPDDKAIAKHIARVEARIRGKSSKN